MSYDDTNRGQIWKNDKKESDKHPDFKGSVNVEGVEYWVSAWKRRPDASPNAPALSFSVRPKDQQPHQARQQPAHTQQPAPSSAGGGLNDFDDDIPFMRITGTASMAI